MKAHLVLVIDPQAVPPAIVGATILSQPAVETTQRARRFLIDTPIVVYRETFGQARDALREMLGAPNHPFAWLLPLLEP